MNSSLLAVVFCATSLVACSSQISAPVRHIAPQDVVSDNTMKLLHNLAPGQSAQLTVSPWGDNVNITLLQKYHAATGFECIRLKLPNSAALTCQNVDNLWLVEPTYI